ncbi:hypothetical protein SPRG_09945 [Saprolegnia parasitica CBS 223.65]|uniref:Uncharacterized protein n=1 Tax=Saprolegnia parasitica (strain CBS 223.65) TaxID=695850 RepID=A0A067C8L5_SAPPC|nr:hypothetical protein SPRG_09945 [Saprolegnia parasitica CBS 223.65]KDO23137.1 hypothetical protein SPRG_09945 [Saprolegnia parasitica CBS 223.65]|eukprot:XP_012206089.1 hypothetical protein SPRG_09945 [Saprolegnia parasitica CBS 223.65]
MASLQKTTPLRAVKAPRGAASQDLTRAMAYQNHLLEIQLAECQRELLRCQQRLAAGRSDESRPEEPSPEALHDHETKTLSCYFGAVSNNAQSI